MPKNSEPPLLNGVFYVPQPDGTDRAYQVVDGMLEQPVEVSVGQKIKLKVTNLKDIPGWQKFNFSNVSIGYVVNSQGDNNA